MPIFKSDAKKFSFDLTDLQLDVRTTTFAKNDGALPQQYTNMHVLASRAESISDDEFSSTEVARLSVAGNTRDVVGVLVRALAEIAGADPLDVKGMVASAAMQTEFYHFLLFAVDPKNVGMNTFGQCGNCSSPAAARTVRTDVSSWVHIGPSCGPGEGTFVQARDLVQADRN